MVKISFALLYIILCAYFCVCFSQKKIGIIGSGVGGSSLAYWLKNFTKTEGDYQIVIFEKERFVGGRAHTVEIAGVLVEVGGSVHHLVNYLFKDLANTFNLTSTTLSGSGQLGVWNGKNFDFLTSSWRIITYLEIFTKYGLSPLWVEREADLAKRNLIQWYSKEDTFFSVEEFLSKYNLSRFTNITGEKYLSQIASTGYSNQVVAGMTRVTYNQDLSQIHALGTLISVEGSGDNLFKLKEGNQRLVQELIKASKAKLHLNASVTQITKKDSQYVVKYNGESEESFDILVIACPLEFAGIQIDFTIPDILKREFQHVFVTFVHGVVNPHYFGFETASELPSGILTSTNATSPFMSFGLAKSFDNGSILCKFFSRDYLKDQDLDKIFSSRVSTTRFEWNAYPKLNPTEKFPPIVLADNLYYANALESALSVMETEMIVAKNIARIITGVKFKKGNEKSKSGNVDL